MDQQLTRNQARAVQALIGSKTVAEAAQRAKVSERSIYNWFKLEHFDRALKEARRQSLAQATVHLQQIATRAVETLYKVMEDDKSPASSRVSAARWSLDMAYRAASLEDIGERINALEELDRNGSSQLISSGSDDDLQH